jgi:tetratricopeptide (TPR) repeat protein
MRVVITSRRAAWPAHHRLRLIDLNPLPRADSLALLRRTSPRLASAADSLLAALAAALHDLPLALHLAGLHLKLKPRLSADAYLAQLSQLGGALAQSDLPAELAELPTGHGLRLFETFHASWTLLNEQTALDAAARRLFLACGWCAPNLPIPYDVLEEFAQIEARRGGWPDGNDTEIDLPMQRLMAIGLLALTDEAAGPSIHPLLAEFARRLDEQTAAKDGPRALTRITVALIHRGEAALLSRLPADIAPYLPHVLSAVERVGAVYPLGAAVLLNMLGSIFYIRGDYAAARPAFERAIEIYATLPGDRRSQMATTYHNLGLLLRTISDLSGAYHYFEQSLALKGEIEDEQDADMAPTLASIGLLLKEMGDFPAAREYLERALAIYRTVFGEQHAFVAEAYNNLGTLDLALDDLPAAREYFERSLAGSRAAFGEQHPTVATALDNLGGVLHRSGKTAAAREYVEQALAIRRLKLGEQHPYVATSLNNLGVLLGELGEQPAARTHFLQALEILTLTLPPDHPDIIALYENLAKLDEEEEK